MVSNFSFRPLQQRCSTRLVMSAAGHTAARRIFAEFSPLTAEEWVPEAPPQAEAPPTSRRRERSAERPTAEVSRPLDLAATAPRIIRTLETPTAPRAAVSTVHHEFRASGPTVRNGTRASTSVNLTASLLEAAAEAAGPAVTPSHAVLPRGRLVDDWVAGRDTDLPLTVTQEQPLEVPEGFLPSPLPLLAESPSPAAAGKKPAAETQEQRKVAAAKWSQAASSFFRFIDAQDLPIVDGQ
jgi:hypothetical protein